MFVEVMNCKNTSFSNIYMTLRWASNIA